MFGYWLTEPAELAWTRLGALKGSGARAPGLFLVTSGGMVVTVISPSVSGSVCRVGTVIATDGDVLTVSCVTVGESFGLVVIADCIVLILLLAVVK